MSVNDNAAQRLSAELLSGDPRALARAITLVENEESMGNQLLIDLYRHTGRAYIVGFTGPPGGGKSTLINGVACFLAEKGKKVGIVAIDPTSPFSGGSILGDRVRMLDSAANSEVFIRSLATRGYLGGLSKATGGVIQLMDAAGKDVILVETVGTGQSEIDICRFAHTNIVLLIPGMGDDIQALKAGIMEIADIFVVNKSDRTDADRLVSEISTMIHLGNAQEGWKPTIVKTVASDGLGISELIKEIDAHYEFLNSSPELLRRELKKAEIMVEKALIDKIMKIIKSRMQTEEWDQLILQVAGREKDPMSTAGYLLETIA